jgi:hypothetical protein
VTDEYKQKRQSPEAIKTANARAFHRIQSCTSQQVEPEQRSRRQDGGTDSPW